MLLGAHKFACLLTNHVPGLQYPEELQVQVLLVESSSSLLGFAGGWVEGDTVSCHEVFQMRPLQLGHPLKGAFEKDINTEKMSKKPKWVCE